ncbi:MAG: hypothetical protein IPP44_07880 [Ideonella sp.]|nr:hypothetical protein [Ideonella sp.]
MLSGVMLVLVLAASLWTSHRALDDAAMAQATASGELGNCSNGSAAWPTRTPGSTAR